MGIPRRKLGFLSAAFLLAAIAPVACAPSGTPPAPGEQQAAAEKPRYGGVFSGVSIAADPPNMDLHTESGANLVRTISAAFDTLIRWDAFDRDKLAPDLAEKWEVAPDGKTITFRVRQGVKFHSGDPLTATDVKFTLDRIRGVITTGPGALPNAQRKDLLSAIQSVETPDNNTVILKLSQAQTSLFEIFANGRNPIYSKTWIEAGNDPLAKVNGTGPFKLKSYIRGTSLEFEKNASYWNEGLPYLDGVKNFIIPDQSTVFAALRTGQVMRATLTPEQENSLQPQIAKGEVPLTLITVPRGQTTAQFFINVKQKPYDDLRVRQAITMAVDRNDFIKIAGREGTVPSSWVIPGTYWGLPDGELEKIIGYKKDKAAERAEAKKLLAAAGFPEGFTVRGMVRNEPSSVDAAIRWADQLSKIGIKMEIGAVDLANNYERFAKGDYALSPFAATAGTTPDPDTFYGQFLLCGSPRNYSGWCDEKFETLFKKQSAMLDPAERRKVVWEIEKYVMEQVPTLPMGYSSPTVYASNKDVRGWVPHYDDSNHSRSDTLWLASN